MKQRWFQRVHDNSASVKSADDNSATTSQLSQTQLDINSAIRQLSYVKLS